MLNAKSDFIAFAPFAKCPTKPHVKPLILEPSVKIYSLFMVSVAAAAATILFSVSDPQGDPFGDGAYTLPAARADAAQLDLRTFTALDNNGKLELRLTFGRVQNPDRAPNGFSVPVIDVFLGSGRGGAQTLADTGFKTTLNRGFKYHLRVTPWSSSIERNKRSAGNLPDSSGVKVAVQGASIVIDTGLPAASYTYWALVSLYDPLTQNGVARPQASPSPLKLVTSLENPPSALEVLMATSQVGSYATREIAPLNEPVLETNPLLFTAIAGVVLALVTTIWGLFVPRNRY